MGIDKELPQPETSNIRPKERTYIDQWSQSHLIDPDVVNNEYYTLRVALEALKAGATTLPATIDLQRAIRYRDRQKNVCGYTDEEVEYLMSKSDPALVSQYDSIMGVFAAEAEEIFRAGNIQRMEQLADQMKQLSVQNNK